MKLLFAFLKPYSRNLLVETLQDKCSEHIEFGNYVAAGEMATLINSLGFEIQANELWNKIKVDKEHRQLIIANQAI